MRLFQNKSERYPSFYLMFIVIFLLLVQNAFAGGWTQKQGKGFYKIGTRLINTDQFYDSDGTLTDIATFGEYTVNFYGEYGITNRITAVLNAPFKRITLNKQIGETSGFVFFGGDSKNGISDIDAGVRFGLRQGGQTVLSADVMFGIPVGDDAQPNGLLTGCGEFSQKLMLQLGHSVYSMPLYFNTSAGVKNRSGGFSDEFHYTAEIGYSLSSHFLLILRANGLEPFRNGDDNTTGGMGGLCLNNQRYLLYGPELIFNFNDSFGISAGFESATRAQNTLSGALFTFGVFLK